MATTRTEPTFASVFTQSLGKGLADYAIERQRAHDAGRENALMQYKMQVDQQEQKQRAQERDLNMNLLRLRGTQINEELRRSALEGYLTPEQKQKYELEQIAARAQAERDNRIAQYDYLRKNGITSTGRSASGGGSQVPLLTKILPTITALQGQNTGIAKANAATMGKYEGAKADALMFGEPPPQAPDTLPHINIGQMIQPFLQSLGADSAQVQQILQGLQPPQAANPLLNQKKTIDTITPEDLLNMSDEELEALIGS